MKQLQIFDFAPEEKPPEKIVNRCRKCKHIYRHQYGKMQYCNKQKDKKTTYGNKKIKANSAACFMFEEKEK